MYWEVFFCKGTTPWHSFCLMDLAYICGQVRTLYTLIIQSKIDMYLWKHIQVLLQMAGTVVEDTHIGLFSTKIWFIFKMKILPIAPIYCCVNSLLVTRTATRHDYHCNVTLRGLVDVALLVLHWWCDTLWCVPASGDAASQLHNTDATETTTGVALHRYALVPKRTLFRFYKFQLTWEMLRN